VPPHASRVAIGQPPKPPARPRSPPRSAFPCNQFGGQEPGAPGEVKAFAKSHYNVTFPLFMKVEAGACCVSVCVCVFLCV
jgi:hypothetical protein